MNDQEKRIKLAEAMGITEHRCINCEAQYAFDPFTDANDDYAVLEWMRNQTSGFSWVLSGLRLSDYHVGDNARAALKVIE